MNSFLNYMIEANAALCVFALAYVILLRNETDFRLKRFFLLGGVITCVVFPLIHISSSDSILPTLSNVIPTVWLPEYTFGVNDPQHLNKAASLNAGWTIVSVIYACGVCSFLTLFIIQLFRLLKLVTTHNCYVENGIRISESNAPHSSFSFFRFVYIGNAHTLLPCDKSRIIAHERVHAIQLHSFDILLINILGIFFWFNPIIRVYHKIFIQLHEFEADARAVKPHEVNEYCNLLARVALMSADISMANYFNNSLTLKRIEMIRRIKFKVRLWKIAALCTLVGGIFFVSACHDQVLDDAAAIAKNSTVALDVPSDVQESFDALKSQNPDKKLVLMEVDDNGKAKLAGMQKMMNSIDQKDISAINVIKPTAKKGEPVRNFMIIVYDDRVAEVGERSKISDVYTIAEEPASFVGGQPAMWEYMGNNMKYPKEAKDAGIEGKVMVEFIVETDGRITNTKVLAGVAPALDAEALRIVSESPAWNPAKNNGTVVRQRFVLPINFRL
jgi:TonB family protein